jgi:hypothetical protein
VTLNIKLTVALRAEDLAGVPAGTRIATNDNKILELDMVETPTMRPDAGQRYWIVPGTLEPFYEPPARWFPAFILPPAIDLKASLDQANSA